MRAVAVAVSAALLGVCAAEELKPSRVHLVDSFTGADGVTNYLFRGNMPINATGFAYDQVLDLMRDRIGGAGLGKLPDDIYLHVINFNSPFEIDDVNHELQFFRWFPKLGATTGWLLVGNPVSPKHLPSAVRDALADEVIWAVDELPKRAHKLREMLVNPGTGRPTAIYFHCEAGCDRTGEMAFAYRLANTNATAAEAWKLNVQECGRPPNNFSKGAQEWFCYWAKRHAGHAVGSCEDW